MTRQTATGYPYPEGTDRLMDGDDAIKNLAAAIPQVQGGNATITPSAANVSTALRVNFPKPFPVGVTPVVVATIYAGAALASRGVSTSVADNTGFTLNLVAPNQTALPINWIAYAPGQL